MKKPLHLFLILTFIICNCSYSQNTAHDTISINNISARINNNGNLFWDHIGYSILFNVPKGSLTGTIFNTTLWVAGLDSVDTLHVAAETYDQRGHDFWSGPISNVYDSAYDAKWDNVWKIKKTDIDYHLAHCWQPGYVPSQALLNYPGNGDTSLVQTKIIAPFYDWNHDGVYNPYAGDYPLIKGDEAIVFIINDARKPHTESGGNKIDLDIVGMAYAFACNDDSALWNTIFLNYKISNRSQNIYHDSYIGLFSDLDLGFANDDYMGCDVQRGSFYAYNGRNIDGYGQSNAYGAHPPAQSVTFLAGPKIAGDGIDNPLGQCNEDYNGYGFGNGIIDDERLGLSKFIYFNSSGAGNPWYTGDPAIPKDYYCFLQGKWKDNIQMSYGGNAYIGMGASYGPDCNYMFPGNSDTCNWGTSGLAPNGPKYWTETTAGNQPDDRRGLGSSGPFTFYPGDTQELDVALVFGRNYTDTNASAAIPIIQQRIDSVKKYFANDKTPCGGSFSSIINHQQINPQIKIYPNPSDNFITIEISAFAGAAKYEMFDMVGRTVNSGSLKSSGKDRINISNLSKGLYFLNITDGKNKFSRKFIKQ